ncbi:MAG: peroxidase [Alphaproteobacteria bacterium]|nr:peroxidase [Alphaproteobacteria bacterium]
MPSLPAVPGTLDLWRFDRTLSAHLNPYSHVLMLGPSAMSNGERDLIGVYVSALNRCRFAYRLHVEVSTLFGLPRAALDALWEKPEPDGFGPKMRPILAYARTLTRAPASATQADANAIYAAGWDEQTFFQAVNIAAYFNFMNRLLNGTGVDGNRDDFVRLARQIVDIGYVGRT